MLKHLFFSFLLFSLFPPQPRHSFKARRGRIRVQRVMEKVVSCLRARLQLFSRAARRAAAFTLPKAGVEPEGGQRPIYCPGLCSCRCSFLQTAKNAAKTRVKP